MLSVTDVTYQYKSGDSIRFPDFSLGRGQQCVLLGESGSGKTTLLHLIGGLLRLQSGLISIDGISINSLSESNLDHYRGSKIGFIFQRNHLITALTVKENLRLSPFLAGLPKNDEDIISVASRLGLFEKLNVNVTKLSQGQMQRVAIARAVLNKPSLILADEPTSALDDSNCSKVIGLLREVAAESNATLLIATHDQRLKAEIESQIFLTHKSVV